MPEVAQQESLEEQVARLESELAQVTIAFEREFISMKIRAERLSTMLVSLIDDVALSNYSLFGDSLTYRERELLREIRDVLAKTTTEERNHG